MATKGFVQECFRGRGAEPLTPEIAAVEARRVTKFLILLLFVFVVFAQFKMIEQSITEFLVGRCNE